MRSMLIGSLLCLVGLAVADNILLLPIAWRSHVMQMVAIGNRLVERGHEVHLVLYEGSPLRDSLRLNETSINVLTYKRPQPDLFSPQMNFGKKLAELRSESLVNIYRGLEGLREVCENILGSKELEDAIKAANIDIAIVMTPPLSRCLLVLPYRLGLRFISLSVIYEPWLLRSPALPSVVPFMLASPPLTPTMTFWERLTNLWQLVSWSSTAANIPFLADDLVTKYAPGKPTKTLDTIAHQSELWFIDTDVGIDYPRPLMPNEVNIGGILTKPANPLPPGPLLDHISSPGSLGSIIVSFSSENVVPPSDLDIVVAGLRLLPTDFRIVVKYPYKYTGDDAAMLPDNILLLPWIPQNDLLGDSCTRLLVSHCGGNSQFEALYHGVPLVCMPLLFDQPYNAARAQHHGFTTAPLSISSLRAEDVRAAAEEVLSNSTYRQRIQKASGIFRTQVQPPMERAVWWVERVLNWGAADLRRDPSDDLSAAQFLLLDVAGALLAAAMGGAGVVAAITWATWRHLRRGTKA